MSLASPVEVLPATMLFRMATTPEKAFPTPAPHRPDVLLHIVELEMVYAAWFMIDAPAYPPSLPLTVHVVISIVLPPL